MRGKDLTEEEVQKKPMQLNPSREVQLLCLGNIFFTINNLFAMFKISDKHIPSTYLLTL